MRLGNNFPPAGKPIPFRVVIYNDQNSYDLKKGLFTCEHPGVYEFHFNCAINDKGELVVHSFTSSQKTAHITASGTAIIKLAKGDEVFLVAKHGANGLLSDSYFSGHLVFTE